MAGTFPDAGTGVRPTRAESVETEHGSGWVTFAGIMLALVGTLNFIYGIAAISDSRFYVQDATYILSDLNAYGWLLLCIGIVQIGVALAIWAGSEWGRGLGVFAAGCNAVVQLLFIAAYPFAALALFAIDILVIYGLVAYGGRRSAA